MGLSLDNTYATNACKNFFIKPPTAITELNVLEASAPIWLPVLRAELAQFPEALVISLGQPVLSMLVKPGFSRQMRDYWATIAAGGRATVLRCILLLRRKARWIG